MIIEITEPVNRAYWLETLGVNFTEEMDESVEHQLYERIDTAEKQLLEVACPKAIYRVMNREMVRTEGFSIEKHLEGCSRVAVMGATLGAAVDDLIRKTQIVDMAMAVIIDCGASVLIEYVCDKFEEHIKSQISGYTTSRFSPGYGDYPLECQRDIVRCIDGQRKIGLFVTSDSLMIPRKSVTALIGISDNPVTGHLATCAECVLRGKCILRKEGKLCSDRF